MAAVTSDDDAPTLSGLDAQAHARAVLAPALRGGGGAQASHAYLFHGPPGSGKRTVARAFAAALLARDAGDAEQVASIRARIERGSHPDLTWVTRSGAAEMLVSDIEQPVVAAAARTPFESARRVFVIEAVEFSEGFTDLHTRSYQEIIAGRGFGLDEVRTSIDIVSKFRDLPVVKTNGVHPFAIKANRA